MVQPWDFDVIVLGAGAAGLMAAQVAASRGRRTLVLDHAEAAGKKILISGGGRANFTNINATYANYLSANPNFARSALARYTPQDFLALVEHHKIPWHEKHSGQLFCDRSARDIVQLLLKECAEAKAKLELGTTVHKITLLPSTGFKLETNQGTYASQSLIVATGGLSIPKMGATGFGYEVARNFGLQIVQPRPGLVPLTLAEPELAAWCDLPGASTTVRVSTTTSERSRDKEISFVEKALITHRGISGPGILQISSYLQPGSSFTLDLAPDAEVFTALMEPGARRTPVVAAARLREYLPARWANRWMELALPAVRGDLSTVQLKTLEARLHGWTLTPAGNEGYPKAEVTAGGVSTEELDPKTMQCKKVPGLYFIGEVVDVTGWLGGYNFQWAWSSGYCAGSSA
jgi:predicted Rossmann fold flavoprotein